MYHDQYVAYLEGQLRNAEADLRDPERTQILRRQLAAAQRQARGVAGIVDSRNQPDPFTEPRPPERPGQGRRVTRLLSTGAERVWEDAP